MTDPTLDSLRLSWTVPEGHFDSFVVQFKDRDGPRVVPVEGHERSVTVTPLDTGHKYRFLLYGLLGKKRHGPLTAEGTTGESIPAWPGSAPGAPPGWGSTQPGQGRRWSFVLAAITILILLTQPHSTSPVGLSHGKALSLDLSALPLEVSQATRNSLAAPLCLHLRVLEWCARCYNKAAPKAPSRGGATGDQRDTRLCEPRMDSPRGPV